jgi:subtilisin family serine protease
LLAAFVLFALGAVAEASDGLEKFQLSSLYHEGLLKTHGLSHEEDFIAALQREQSMSLVDTEYVRIRCVGLYTSFQEDLQIVYVNNQLSVLCYAEKTKSLDDETQGPPRRHSEHLLSSHVTPPVLKIQESVISHLSQCSDSSSSASPSSPYRPDVGGLNHIDRKTIFIELFPGADDPEMTFSVAEEVFLLAPLLQRYRFDKSGDNNSGEWHYILLKAVTRKLESESDTSLKAELNSIEGINDDDDNDAIQKQPWQSFVEEAVHNLISVRRHFLHWKNMIKSDAMNMSSWLDSARHITCPCLEELSLALKEHGVESERVKDDNGDFDKATLSRPPSLVQLYGNSIQVHLPTDANDMSLTCLIHMIQSAAAHPLVMSVSVGPSFHFSNYDAVSVSQSGTPHRQPYRKAGLLGRGQVCGVADTGLDDTSCFFRDYFPTGSDDVMNDKEEERRFYYRSPTTKRGRGVEIDRRKVIQYVPYADTTDMAGGHGTHVCGTVAGHSISTANEAVDESAAFDAMNGVAPLAKLSFFDIGYGMGATVLINMPRLFSNLFPTQYQSGARVSSNSWAGGSVMYGQMSREVDDYLYQNPDFLVVFASGNRGLMMMGNSIGSPANAKNSICVGATQLRTMYSDVLFPPEEHTITQLNSMGPSYDGRMKPDLLAPGYFLMSAYASDVSEQIRAQRIQYGKTESERIRRWENISRFGRKCTVHEKSGSSMSAPVVSGSALLIREYFVNPEFWLQTCLEGKSSGGMCCRGEAFEPSGYLTKALLLHSTQTVPLFGDKDVHNLMGGPPPRHVGTSFGASAHHKHPHQPDTQQGYGEINLENILPLPVAKRSAMDFVPKPLNLIVFDRLKLNEMESVGMDVVVDTSAGVPPYLKVTISWYDPPSAVGWAPNLLIHDIDMIVRGPWVKSEKLDEYVKHADFDTFWGNGRDGGDHRNVNEQVVVILPDKPLTNHQMISGEVKYTVTLVSHSFPKGKRVFNMDGSLTLRKIGTQDASVVITSNAPITVADIREMPEAADSKLCPSSLVDTVLEDVAANASPAQDASGKDGEIKSHSLSSALTSSHAPPLRSGSSPTIHQRHVSFEDIHLGIHSTTQAGEVVFGSFENDVAQLDDFHLPPLDAARKSYALVGISVCLDSPHINTKGSPRPQPFVFRVPRSPGADAYLLAITIRSPSGKSVQVGGFGWIQPPKDQFYHRFWPFLWMSPTYDARNVANTQRLFCPTFASLPSGDSSFFGQHKFAAYRDLIFAELSDVGNSQSWRVEASYGIPPFGESPRVSFSGDLGLYFEEVFENESIKTSSFSADFLPLGVHKEVPKHSSHSSMHRILSSFLLVTFLVTLMMFACRLKKFIRGAAVQAPPANGCGDHRTPLSGRSLPLHSIGTDRYEVSSPSRWRGDAGTFSERRGLLHQNRSLYSDTRDTNGYH